MANNPINFVALLNGMAEELNLPLPSYHQGQRAGDGSHTALCRFGNASTEGSGHTIIAARNAAACIMWSNLGNGVRANTR